MIETVKYCPQCNNRLASIAPRTENEIEFYKASQFRLGTIPDQDRLPLTQEGACDNCGRHDILTYYRISGTDRVTLIG